MDERRFDELIRRLGEATTRRSGLKAAVGGLLGLAGLAELAPEAGATKEAKRRRRRNRGEDGPPVGFGLRCKTDSDCPVAGQRCLYETFCSCPLVDGKPQDPCSGVCCKSDERCLNGNCICTDGERCGGVCCKAGERCLNGTCSPGCQQPLINGTDYSGCDFSGQSFSYDDYPDGLQDISFDFADLRQAEFVVSLNNVTFRNANMNNIRIWSAGPLAVRGTTVFDGATLDDCSMFLQITINDQQDPPSISFREITARNGHIQIVSRVFDRSLSFVRADLTQADLRDSDLRWSDFTASILVDTDFRGSSLMYANFKSADVSCNALPKHAIIWCQMSR